MLQNRSIAHNFVYGINPGSRSGNMFWENNRYNSRYNERDKENAHLYNPGPHH